MDITHIFVPGRTGGLERVVEMLAIGQAARGHRVSVVAIRPAGAGEAPAIERLAAHDVAVTLVTVAGRAYAAERRAFRELMSGRERGVVHTHGYRADVIYAPVASRLGFPVVSTLHGFTGGGLKNRLYEYLQRRASRRFDQVVVVSRPIADQMRRMGVGSNQLHLIQNAYKTITPSLGRAEARARLGIDTDRFVLGWVGRFSYEKGADVFLESLASLADLPVRAVYVGEGPQVGRLEARADELRVSHLIQWTGAVDGMSALFKAFDAFILSSRTEGTPIVLFEAMAAGVPVVATSVGGVPDVVTSNEAVLVPAESPTLLADAIRSLIQDRVATQGRVESAARTLRERFSPDPWLDRYDEVYSAAAHRQRAK